MHDRKVWGSCDANIHLRFAESGSNGIMKRLTRKSHYVM